MSANRNEGEGNKTAAREFNDAQRNFVSRENVEAKARDAARALDGPERKELLEAEAVGKSRAAPDPEIDEHKIRARAHGIWEREGQPEGRHEDHWRQAQLELQELASEAEG
jgi:hypothetical protein